MNESNEQRTLRDEIAGIVAEYCGGTHRPEDGTLVFDMSEATFVESADPAHLVRRLAEHLAPLSEMRPEVMVFAVAMEMKLRQNDHKGGWELETRWDLFDRLIEELDELHQALRTDAGILPEAVDVANFAMMIADVTGEVEHFARQIMGRDDDSHAE